jgi:cysteine desulfurase/selenocysteine lyase
MNEDMLTMLREQFPLLDRKIKGRKLVYFDHAATTQKPWAVLRSMQQYYQNHNANIHRGAHAIAGEATVMYEATRDKLQALIGATQREEILFTKGCTEAVNLVASSWGNSNLSTGDRVLVSNMEHHANFVPWQMVAQAQGATFEPIPITDSGEIDLDAYEQLLRTGGVKMVAVTHVSNVLGTINPIQTMARLAHEHGSLICVDGAQALAHGPVCVQDLDADFYTLSGHKMFAPTGTGALYGRKALLDAMPPYQFGGDMIHKVSFEKTTFREVPNRFETGTPNIAGVIGWGAAIDWMQTQDHATLAQHEAELYTALTGVLAHFPEVKIYGNAASKVCIASFSFEGVHPHDLGTILDDAGIAIRTGHHCCMPLMRRLGVPALARMSLNFTNTLDEVAQVQGALRRVIEVLG